MRPTQAAVNWQRRALASSPLVYSPLVSSHTVNPSSLLSSSSYSSSQNSSSLLASSRFSRPLQRGPSPRTQSSGLGPSVFVSLPQHQQPQRRLASISSRATATTDSETTTMASLKEVLTYELLDGVTEFWFEHFESQDSFVLPQLKEQMRWFMGGKELDDICVERFSPALDAIRAAGPPTVDALLEVLPMRSSLDWLGLVILLDQMPRNCYRGAAASVVFNVFDPLARDVADRALALGIPNARPELRWTFSRRFWFYLPLEHSEDMATHERAVVEYKGLVADIEGLLDGTAEDDGSAERREAARVLGANREGALALAKGQMDFEMKHYNIIKQFGRYPHRNAAMGRETTEEEREYLANGGETFGG